MKKRILFLGSLCLMLGGLFFQSSLMAQQSDQEVLVDQVLTLKEFISLAAQKDTVFEEILIDELALQYEKKLALPARDLVLSIKGEYDFMVSQEREDAQTGFSLSKLFPSTATTVSAEYTTTPSFTTGIISSEFALEFAQPIAANAFGKATRLADKIIGVEIDVAQHQIVEAYEDYLAALIVAYYDWHEAFENLQIAKSSYQENLKLLENVKQRQKSKIALPLDVNKTTLLVLAKKEKMINIEQEYQIRLNIIKKAIRENTDSVLRPQEPDLYQNEKVSFVQDYKVFEKESRTYQLLKLLEEKSSLEVDQEADDLLPSIDLTLGYDVKGKDYPIKSEDNKVFVGFDVAWPFPDQVDNAEYETAKIAREKTKLATENTYQSLYSDVHNLSLMIKREQALLDVADEKINLSYAIFEKETENYSFGKVTLNDYIDAVNVLDTNRFNKIEHEARARRLIMEYLRITDQLISKKEMDAQRPR